MRVRFVLWQVELSLNALILSLVLPGCLNLSRQPTFAPFSSIPTAIPTSIPTPTPDFNASSTPAPIKLPIADEVPPGLILPNNIPARLNSLVSVLANINEFAFLLNQPVPDCSGASMAVIHPSIISDGLRTKFDPILKLAVKRIYNSSELIALVDGYNTISKSNIVLMEDISLPTDYKPPRFVDSVLDGNGFKISGLKAIGIESYIGLFRTVESSLIINLQIQNAIIGGDSYVGALAGSTEKSLILNVSINNARVEARDHSGGLVGHANNSVLALICNHSQVVSTGNYNGGVLGGMSGSSTSYLVNAEVVVNGAKYIGGGIGSIEGSFVYQWSVKSQVLADEYIGGMIGAASRSIIADSSNNGEVIGNNYSGGFVGSAGATNFIRCSSNTQLKAKNYIGGFVGSVEENSLLFNCHTAGSVIGDRLAAGGVIGSGGGIIWGAKSSVDVKLMSAAAVSTGGLAGCFHGVIYTSSASGKVQGYRDVGGLVGTLGKGDFCGSDDVGIDVTSIKLPIDLAPLIRDSSATGQVIGQDAVGGLVGKTVLGSIKKSYGSSEVIGDTNIGLLVGVAKAADISEDAALPLSTPPSDYFNIWALNLIEFPEKVFSSENTFFERDGALAGCNLERDRATALSLPLSKAHPPVLAKKIISCVSALPLLNPISISTEEQLLNIQNGKYYQLNADIVLTKRWTPLNRSEVILDGQGHSISNLTVDYHWGSDPYWSVGLFSNLSCSSVKNLNLRKIFVRGKIFVGVIAGRAFSSEFHNIHLESGLVLGDQLVGGLVGGVQDTISIEGVSSDLIVQGNGDVGGIVGMDAGANSQIVNTHVRGTVFLLSQFGSAAGGIVGHSDGNGLQIDSSSASGHVFSNAGQVGGVLGHAGSAKVRISNTSSSGDVLTLASNAGGIVGYSNPAQHDGDFLIEHCQSSGNVVALHAFAGGLAGRNPVFGKIIDSYATGHTITLVDTNAGGIAGINDGYIENTYSTGLIAAGWNMAGGITSQNTASFSKVVNSYSLSDVFSKSATYLSIGGLVGANFGANSQVSASCSLGSVIGIGFPLSKVIRAGGLVGSNRAKGASITNSYSSSRVLGSTYYSGGLVAINRDEEQVHFDQVIATSYSQGRVEGGIVSSGFCSLNSGNIANSYWNKDLSTQNYSSGGEAKSTAEMASADTFQSWDTAIWNIRTGKIPGLSWER